MARRDRFMVAIVAGMLAVAPSAFGIAQRTKEYEDRFANPFVAAARGYIDEVIHPHNTRKRIALGLRKLRNKQLENPWKKHDNIPL